MELPTKKSQFSLKISDRNVISDRWGKSENINKGPVCNYQPTWIFQPGFLISDQDVISDQWVKSENINMTPVCNY